MTHRNAAIDIAKGMGIILVVLGHNWLVEGEKRELFRIIFSFHIPLFLFISGLFIKDSMPLGNFIISRADALLKPYLVVFLLLSIIKLVNPAGYPAITVSPLVFFLRALYATPGYIIWEWLPLWYLPHLFIVMSVAKITLHSTEGSNKRRLWIGVIAVLSMMTGICLFTTVWLTSPRPPFTFDAALISVAFVLTGYLLQEKVQTMVFDTPAFLTAVFMFASLHYFFNETIDLSLRIYSHPIISTLQALLGIYIILSISLAIKQHEILKSPLLYIGSGSLFILLFHNFSQVKTAEILLQWGFDSRISHLTGFIMGIVIPLLFWEITKKQQLLSKIFLPFKSRASSRDFDGLENRDSAERLF